MALLCLSALTPINSRSINGTVYNSNNRQPIAGAWVQVKGDKLFTRTDAKGHYFIIVPDGRIVFLISDTSVIGNDTVYYKTGVANVGKSAIINVSLTPAMRLTADTIEYNSGAYLTPNTSCAVSQILKRLSGVAVMNQGKITYRGISIYRAQVNGKEIMVVTLIKPSKV